MKVRAWLESRFEDPGLASSKSSDGISYTRLNSINVMETGRMSHRKINVICKELNW